jgi:hypothetical protein
MERDKELALGGLQSGRTHTWPPSKYMQGTPRDHPMPVRRSTFGSDVLWKLLETKDLASTTALAWAMRS